MEQWYNVAPCATNVGFEDSSRAFDPGSDIKVIGVLRAANMSTAGRAVNACIIAATKADLS